MSQDELTLKAERSQPSNEQLSPVFEDSATEHFNPGQRDQMPVLVWHTLKLHMQIIASAACLCSLTC